MSEYMYNKKIDISKLTNEIRVGMGLELLATSQIDSVNGYIESNNASLKIIFYENDEEPNENHGTTLVATILTEAQEIQLDSIVTNHVEQSLKYYRLYCHTCTDYKSFEYESIPQKCPACDSTDITDIVEQIPYTTTKDEVGNEWDSFMTTDGSIINARRY